MTNPGADCDRRQFIAASAGALAAAGFVPRVKADEPPASSDWRSVVTDAFARHGEAADSEAWPALRRLFPLDDNLAYFNSAGLGPSPQHVLDTVRAEMAALENISESGHQRVDETRREACALLNCEEDELAITRSTTEGMNAIARGLPLQAGDEILLTTHEHPGGAMPWLALARDAGLVVRTFEPGDSPDETLELIERNLTPRTRVVSVSHVTCTTGYVLPIRRIAGLCRDRGLFSVIDGAQALGIIPVDLHHLGCDFYATSGHKWLLGPKGTGFMYVRRGMLRTWRPTWVGAYSDEDYDLDAGVFESLPEARAIEYGTRNTAMILGLGAAIDFVNAVGIDRSAAHGRALARRIAEGLRGRPEVQVLTPDADGCAASILTLRLPADHMDPWQWCNTLKRDFRIRVRPVGEHGLNGVRVAAHLFNTVEEADRLISAVQQLLNS
ncbi:MAG: aminotransferase class V-fold PLP-dependent enzyme [Phycisphaerales bacterium]|nr:MAG: aminotransferase class V-fold PLP-dependent enzyme [Phycisphaerales bacterium]